MALGRGLSSLIPSRKSKEVLIQKNITQKKSSANSQEDGEHGDAMLWVSLDCITPNPFQPRKKFDNVALQELASSISQHGILQPIVVSLLKNGGDDTYQIIAGERRFRAAKIAGLKKVPVIVRKVVNEDEHLELALLENIQRENLNPIELGFAYRKLADHFHMSQEKIAKRVGKSRQVVGNTIRLLGLPKLIQQDIEAGIISENHARAILSLPTSELQVKLWKEIKENKLSARNTEVAARKYKKIPSKSVARMDALTRDVMVRLESYLSTKVTIEHSSHASDGGKIIIKYFSNEDLDDILEKIIKK